RRLARKTCRPAARATGSSGPLPRMPRLARRPALPGFDAIVPSLLPAAILGHRAGRAIPPAFRERPHTVKCCTLLRAPFPYGWLAHPEGEFSMPAVASRRALPGL